MNCIHCGRELKRETLTAKYPLHDNCLRRCLPFESKQPYGLEATPPIATVEDPEGPIPVLGYDPQEKK